MNKWVQYTRNGEYDVDKPFGKVEMILAIERREYYLLHLARGFFFRHRRGVQLIVREIFVYERVNHHFFGRLKPKVMSEILRTLYS